MGAGTSSCSLKVMTYNIEMKKEDAWGGRNLSSTIASIVNATPDVVGLQEDDSNWRDSGEYSPHHSYVEVLDDPCPRHSGGLPGMRYRHLSAGTA